MNKLNDLVPIIEAHAHELKQPGRDAACCRFPCRFMPSKSDKEGQKSGKIAQAPLGRLLLGRTSGTLVGACIGAQRPAPTLSRGTTFPMSRASSAGTHLCITSMRGYCGNFDRR
jgi:hypothetical protein